MRTMIDRIRESVWMVFVASTWCGQSLAGTPSLEMITPSVGTRGTSFSVVAKGASLKTARTVMFYDPGLRCEKIVAKNDDEIKIDFVVDASCSLGSHPFRLLSDDGFSELRTLTITPFPTVLEDKEADLQVVQGNTTILGTLESDDVDVYSVQANAGERISAEAVGVRLGVTLLDTVLTLRDPKGKVLQRVDDTPLLNQDSAFSYVATETGLYTIEITSAGVNADADSQYALHVGNFPRPHGVFPLGARAGSEMEMTFASSAKDGTGSIQKQMKFDSGLIGTRFFELTDAGVVCPSTIPIRLSTYDQAFVDSGPVGYDKSIVGSGVSAGSVQETVGMRVLKVPVAVHGIIRETAETDSFCFAVHQTGMVSLEVFASRLGSLLDALVEVRDQAGQTVCSGDDFESHDSRLVFEAKLDEIYTASIRDKRKNAGIAYSYCVEIAPLQSSLTAFLPRRSRLSQAGQTIAIPRGNRTLGFLGVHRDRVVGDVKLTFEGLPQGVSADCPLVASSQFVIPVVFDADADADAETTGSFVGVQCTLENGTSEGTTGRFEQIVDLVNGPADAIFQPASVNRLGVAITHSVPYSIEVVKPTVPLSADGTLDITIQVKREPGFDAPIDITFPLLPEWVECEAKTRIAANQDSGRVTLRANRRAAGGVWPMVAEGTPGLTEGNSAKPATDARMVGMLSSRPSATSLPSVSSSLHSLMISEAPIRGSIPSISAERGTQIELECKLEFGDSVPKRLTATLEGLPNRVHADAISIRREDKVARFQLVIEDDAPTGTFDQLVCRLSGALSNQQVSYCVARDTKLIIAAPGASQQDETGRPLSPLEALRRRHRVKSGS